MNLYKTVHKFLMVKEITTTGYGTCPYLSRKQYSMLGSPKTWVLIANAQWWEINVYELTTKKDIVQFFHATCFSPTKHAWIKAVQEGYFATCPGLTTELIQKHLPKSPAKVKGHLKQTDKRICHTKEKVPEDAD